MSSSFSESVVEDAALAWPEAIGWRVAHGPDIAPDMPSAERRDYGEVVLGTRLRDALARLNPALPAEALEDAFRKLARPEGAIGGAQARVIDFDDVQANDWLAVNQFSVAENKHTRRPDVVLFVNGLPLAVLELKNAATENATIWSAFQQLQTYQAEIPSLFPTNGVLVVSDGVEARVGALGAGREWFKPWRTVAGDTLAGVHVAGLRKD